MQQLTFLLAAHGVFKRVHPLTRLLHSQSSHHECCLNQMVLSQAYITIHWTSGNRGYHNPARLPCLGLQALAGQESKSKHLYTHKAKGLKYT